MSEFDVAKGAFRSVSFDVGVTIPRGLDMHDLQASRQSRSISVRGESMGVRESVNLDVNTWLPAAAEHYNISPDIRDYVLHPTVVNVSGIPNTNGDGFGLKDWLTFRPEFGMLAYKTFKGKPTFIEHCFPAGTDIVTKHGHAAIEDIKVGDEVLTHRGRYRKVTELFRNGEKRLSHVTLQGYGTLKVTGNHPMWVVDKRQVFGHVGANPEQTRRWGNRRDHYEEVTPFFRPVTDAYTGDYFVVPLYVGGKKAVSPELAFLTGLFAAEGSYQKYKGVRSGIVLTLGLHEAELIAYTCGILEELGYSYRTYPKAERGTFTLQLTSYELASFMLNAVGEYSTKKYLNKVRSWDIESLRWFLGGYISGDGSVDCVEQRSGRVRCVTVSSRLARDVQNLFARLGVAATVTKSDKLRTMKSHYRTVLGMDKVYTYEAGNPVYHVGASPRSLAFMNSYIVGKSIEVPEYERKTTERLIVLPKMLLVPILSVEHCVEKQQVFNIEVEEDHSYVANGFVAHNCNSNHRIARGAIFDSQMSKLNGFHKAHGRLILLLAYDRNLEPELCRDILNGTHNTYSKGTWYKAYTCSVCGETFTGSSKRLCGHVGNRVVRMPDGRLAYRQCHVLEGFETSAVRSPAFVCASPDPESVMDPRNKERW